MNRIVPTSALALDMIRRWASRERLVLQENTLAGSGAVFSRCGHYRYLLWRRAVPGQPFMSFGMLNPSTADADDDDPTIRRCCRWATATGLSGPLVWNLFALRSPDPAMMKAHSLPTGIRNNDAIDLALRVSALTVAAWGTHGDHLDRAAHVLRRAAVAEAPLHALKLTKGGHPSHPLYLASSLQPQPWDYPA